MQEIMKTSEGLLPVVKTCIDEDYFLDVRRATTHVMYQFLRIYGPMLSGNFSPKAEILMATSANYPGIVLLHAKLYILISSFSCCSSISFLVVKFLKITLHTHRLIPQSCISWADGINR